MLNKVMTTLALLAALSALLGCNEAAPPEDGATTAPAVTATAPDTTDTPAPDADTPGTATPEEGGDTTTADPAADGMEIPPDLVDDPWQAGNITLGLPIAEARARLPVHQTIPRQENWAVDNYTGVLTAGTYADPVRRVLAVICYEGVVVGVNDSMRETDEKFIERYNHLVDTLGPSRAETPAFADGRQFIYKMTHTEPAPDRQYMWADEEREYMYFAARFPEQDISNFALINAAVYDDAATAMEAMQTGGQ